MSLKKGKSKHKVKTMTNETEKRLLFLKTFFLEVTFK